MVPGSVIMLCASRMILLENGEGAQKLFKSGGLKRKRNYLSEEGKDRKK